MRKHEFLHGMPNTGTDTLPVELIWAHLFRVTKSLDGSVERPLSDLDF